MDNRGLPDRAFDVWVVSRTSDVDISKLRRATKAAALYRLYDRYILHDERGDFSRILCMLVLPG
eukprot:COSAG02_NODE_18250_length_951_cov_0.848592_1_plen_64_part_00